MFIESPSALSAESAARLRKEASDLPPSSFIRTTFVCGDGAALMGLAGDTYLGRLDTCSRSISLVVGSWIGDQTSQEEQIIVPVPKKQRAEYPLFAVDIAFLGRQSENEGPLSCMRAIRARFLGPNDFSCGVSARDWLTDLGQEVGPGRLLFWWLPFHAGDIQSNQDTFLGALVCTTKFSGVCGSTPKLEDLVRDYPWGMTFHLRCGNP